MISSLPLHNDLIMVNQIIMNKEKTKGWLFPVEMVALHGCCFLSVFNGHRDLKYCVFRVVFFSAGFSPGNCLDGLG